MDPEEKKRQLKEHIIQYLNLLNMTPDDIRDDEPLFGDGLGLDSIDSIELIVMMEREYGIKIQDPKEGRKILVDINTILQCIESRQATG